MEAAAAETAHAFVVLGCVTVAAPYTAAACRSTNVMVRRAPAMLYALVTHAHTHAHVVAVS